MVGDMVRETLGIAGLWETLGIAGLTTLETTGDLSSYREPRYVELELDRRNVYEGHLPKRSRLMYPHMMVGWLPTFFRTV